MSSQHQSTKPLMQQHILFIVHMHCLTSNKHVKPMFGTHFPGKGPSAYYELKCPMVKPSVCYRVIIKQSALLRRV